MTKVRKYIFMYIIGLLAASVISGLFRYNSIERVVYNIQSTTMDGVLVWASDKLLIIGVVPMMLIILNNIIKSNEHSYVVLTKYKNRWVIWMMQEIRVLALCALTTFFLMLFSADMSTILSGGILCTDINTLGSGEYETYLGSTVSYYSLENIGDINYHILMLKAFIINTIQLFIIVMAANLIEWALNSMVISTIFTFAFCIMFGVNPQAGYSYNIDFLNIRVLPRDFYYELIYEDAAFETIGTGLLAILLLNLVAYLFVRKRDFINRSK